MTIPSNLLTLVYLFRHVERTNALQMPGDPWDINTCTGTQAEEMVWWNQADSSTLIKTIMGVQQTTMTVPIYRCRYRDTTLWTYKFRYQNSTLTQHPISKTTIIRVHIHAMKMAQSSRHIQK
ncbi:hypothetical protein ABKN59_005625 [Abortiporus biennis]